MIIFTDLDGTLLDHETYSFEAARPALAAIKAQGIPLILASSKTASEIAPLQEALDIQHPAIVENGAGIYWPNRPTSEGSDYAKIRTALETMPTALRDCFNGFGDMGINGIIETTGLPREAATLAANRAHSEPGLFSGSDRQRQTFLEALARHGIKATQGGRFLTLSLGASKADRMAEIIAHFSDTDKAINPTLALGDAPNDISMLEAADRGVIVLNPAHRALPKLLGEFDGSITRTTQKGPEGWNEAVLSFLAIRAHS